MALLTTFSFEFLALASADGAKSCVVIGSVRFLGRKTSLASDAFVYLGAMRREHFRATFLSGFPHRTVVNEIRADVFKEGP